MPKSNTTVSRNAVFVFVLLLFSFAAVAPTGFSATYADDQSNQRLKLIQQPTPEATDPSQPTIVPWNMQNVVEQARIGKGTINAVAWSPNSNLLAVGGSLGVWLYDLNNLEEVPRLLAGHRQPVTSVAWSPDGTLLASGSESSLQIWSIVSGEPELQRSGAGVQAIAWSPDGSMLATISETGSIRVWNAAAEEVLLVIANQQKALSLTWSPYGTVIASGSSDGKIRLWDSATGRELRTIELDWNANAVRGLDWAPHGDLLAAGDERGTVTLWDASNGERQYELKGHNAAILDVRWSPDGSVLVTASSDKTVRLWDATTSLPLQVFTAHKHSVLSTTWSSDGNRLISASRDGSVLLWDATDFASGNGFPLRANPDASAPLLDLRLSISDAITDGDLETEMITLENEGEYAFLEGWTLEDERGNIFTFPDVMLWEKGDRIRVYTRSGSGTPESELYWGATDVIELYWGRSEPVWSYSEVVMLKDDRGVVLTSLRLNSGGRNVGAWSAGDVPPRELLDGYSDLLTSVALKPDGEVIAVGSVDGSIKLYASDDGQMLDTLLVHSDSVWDVQWSPDGSLLASAGQDGSIHLWEQDTGQSNRLLETTMGAVYEIAWSPDSSLLASATTDGVVRLWDVATGSVSRAFEGYAGSVTSLAWSPDGTMIVSAVDDDTLRLWDARTGWPLSVVENESGMVVDVAWSPDGEKLASTSYGGAIQLWDADNERLLQILEVNSGVMWSIAWSPDGVLLATSGIDGTIQLWDSVTGFLLRNLRGHVGTVQRVVWSPDGATLISTGNDGSVRMWNTSSVFDAAEVRQLPSNTATSSSRWETTPPASPTATHRPLEAMTFTPWPSVTPSFGLPTSAPGDSFTPNTEATSIYAPIAPPGNPGEVESSAPPLPEQSSVIVSYAGQVVPLLALTGGLDAAPLAQGDIFDIVPGTGMVAAISGVLGRQSSLFINGHELRVLPSSEFGLNPNLRYTDVEWSPDGARLAFHIDATNPDDPTALHSGVWVYTPGADTAHQVFRTGFEGHVAQAHEQRAATAITWSPDGSTLLIRVTTPRGFANVVTPASHDVNLAPEGGFIESLPFADATWAANGGDVIVSGAVWDGGPEVVGRIDTLTGQYTEYLNQQTTGLAMRAAFEVEPGLIAFLGGPSPDGFALYTMPAEPDATPQPVSGLIPGQVQHAEWSRTRRAALVTVQSPTGPRLWIVRLDGAIQEIMLPSGLFTDAKWGDISVGVGTPAEEGEEIAIGIGTDLGVVTVGMNAEYPPFEYVDEDGNVAGFDVDLMNAIAEAAGFDIEFVNTRWDGIFVALQSGEFDAVASAATITDEREEIVDFSNPYFNAGQTIAVLESRADEINSVDDLAGLRVGVQAGTTGDIWASENIPGVEMVRYDEITLAFQALANGDIDAVFNDGPTSADIISQNPEMGAVIVGDPVTNEFYGIAVQPDQPDLLDAINEALAAIIKNGTYRNIYMEWFGTEPPGMFQPAEQA